jgi:hypothetical protein
VTKDRREHYVPVMYPKQFGDVLCVFDKKTGKTFRSTPKDVAYTIFTSKVRVTSSVDAGAAASSLRHLGRKAR